jgi:hypothetical protein
LFLSLARNKKSPAWSSTADWSTLFSEKKSLSISRRGNTWGYPEIQGYQFLRSHCYVLAKSLFLLGIEHEHSNNNSDNDQVGDLNAQCNNIIQDRKAHSDGSFRACARAIVVQLCSVLFSWIRSTTNSSACILRAKCF